MPPVFLFTLILSTLIDALVAFGLLVGLGRAQPRGLTLGRVGGAVVLTAIVFTAKLMVLIMLGLRMFGLIHLLYLDMVIVLPILAAAVLVLRKRLRPTPAVRGLAVVLLIAAPAVGVYATFVEPYRLQVERPVVPLAAGRDGEAPLTIGILADIQTSRVGAHELAGIDAVMASAPDIVLIPGDFVQGWSGQRREAAAALRRRLETVRAPGGVYAVRGNCESSAFARELFEGLDVTYLENEIVQTRVRDRLVTIGGVDLDCTGPAARAVIGELESRDGAGDVRLLVAHRPDALLAMRAGTHASRIDLLVAGHTHGGQVRLPLLGPPLTLSAVPRAVAAGGLHVRDGRRVYVSRGLGWERGQAPRIRFLCPPEVTVMTLTDGG